MLVIKIDLPGVREETVTFSDENLLKYINKQDFDIRLKYATGIEIETVDVKDQLKMLAAFVNKLVANELNPAQIISLRAFLQDKIDKISK